MTRIQLRRGTAAQWTSQNPVLLQGEPGFESDTGFFKIGDGVTAWASLQYEGGSGTSLPDGFTATGDGAAPRTLTIQAQPGQSDPLLSVVDSDGNALVTVNLDGSVSIEGTAHPQGGMGAQLAWDGVNFAPVAQFQYANLYANDTRAALDMGAAANQGQPIVTLYDPTGTLVFTIDVDGETTLGQFGATDSTRIGLGSVIVDEGGGQGEVAAVARGGTAQLAVNAELGQTEPLVLLLDDATARLFSVEPGSVIRGHGDNNYLKLTDDLAQMVFDASNPDTGKILLERSVNAAKIEMTGVVDQASPFILLTDGTGNPVLSIGPTLDTADPHVAGRIWNSAGTLKVSAG